MEITDDMIQINTLYGHENVKDFYYIKGYDVYNIVTEHKKTVTYNPNRKSIRYPYVTLETKNGKNKKCLMHHLVALSMIENKPYVQIEHLDDVKTNYDVSNLIFSKQKDNLKRMFQNGISNRVEKFLKFKRKMDQLLSELLKKFLKIAVFREIHYMTIIINIKMAQQEEKYQKFLY